MNHSPDPQLCTMSDAEEGFRNELREVFGEREWTDVEEARGPYLCARCNDAFVSVDKYGGALERWTVQFDGIEASHKKLRDTADLARKYVSSAVRALESVGMEVEP